MRKNWLLLGIACLVAVLAIGAVACSDDDDDDTAPTATEEQMDDLVDDDMDDEMDDATATVIVTDGILTDSAGNTLYIFDADEAGLSNCNEGCVDIWPPLITSEDVTAGDGVGTLAVITRADGGTQVTHDDQPLYHFASDEAPGDRNGDGIGDVWHIIMVGG